MVNITALSLSKIISTLTLKNRDQEREQENTSYEKSNSNLDVHLTTYAELNPHLTKKLGKSNIRWPHQFISAAK